MLQESTNLQSQIKLLSTGYDFSMVVKSDGSVWAWGANDSGQLGDGKTKDRHKPVRVPLDDVTAIASSEMHTIALQSGGAIWAWGHHWGQIGKPHDSSQPTDFGDAPGLLSTLSDIVAIGTGRHQAIALKADGTVWIIANVTTADDRVWHPTPWHISSLTDISTINIGEYHNLAIKTDGTVWAWGLNSEGQLGIGTVSQGSSRFVEEPSQVIGLSDVVAVSAGVTYSLALRDDGSVWTWGANNLGELGAKTQKDHYVPSQITGLESMVAVIAGSEHGLALSKGGSVWYWGYNEIGRPSRFMGEIVTEPMRLEGFDGITSAASKRHILACTSDNILLAWGPNERGQLGDGTTTNRHSPIRVAGI